jgi:hypothetical protein
MRSSLAAAIALPNNAAEAADPSVFDDTDIERRSEPARIIRAIPSDIAPA